MGGKGKRREYICIWCCIWHVLCLIYFVYVHGDVCVSSYMYMHTNLYVMLYYVIWKYIFEYVSVYNFIFYVCKCVWDIVLYVCICMHTCSIILCMYTSLIVSKVLLVDVSFVFVYKQLYMYRIQYHIKYVLAFYLRLSIRILLYHCMYVICINDIV